MSFLIIMGLINCNFFVCLMASCTQSNVRYSRPLQKCHRTTTYTVEVCYDQSVSGDKTGDMLWVQSLVVSLVIM